MRAPRCRSKYESCRAMSRCPLSKNYVLKPRIPKEEKESILIKQNIPPQDKTGARQQPGFDNEKRVVEKYDLIPEKKNHKWDAHTKPNKDGVSRPVSIKSSEANKPIEMSSLIRNTQVKEDFYLHVSTWEHGPKTYEKEYLLLIPYQKWNKLFPSIFNFGFSQAVAKATVPKRNKDVWNQEKENLLRDWETLDTPIRVSPKWSDGKSKQNRFQSRMPIKTFRELCRDYEVDGFN